MKRKWKWLVPLLCLPVLLFAVWLWTVGGRQIPVDVIGDLPEKDVAEIVAAAKRELRRYILPNFSWQTFKDMPAAIRRYSSIKLITVWKEHPDFAYVHFWKTTNGVSRFSSKTIYANSFHFGQTSLPEPVLTYFNQANTNAYLFCMSRNTNGWQTFNLLR
jgi:hypothetical protein